MSTTRGSLTYIGRYISGAKSVLPTPSWKTAKSARAVRWLFGHEVGGGGGGLMASLRLF